MPGMSGMMGLPVPSAKVLQPAASAEEGAAKSRKNLQLIALALHNYHDSYTAFPAAYNVDAEGKPLLSWRVHILPFLEQNALYERFRLDEPWDSEHNRQLIELMPAVYRSPDSEAEAGTTRYLGNATAAGIFVAPRGDENAPRDARFPRGIRIRDILDGTSNTIMVIEANEAAAVIWTKPDDFAIDEREDPRQKLLEPGQNSFLAAFCDGSSVRLFIDSMDRSRLDALFTRNGGEVIPE